ncbi:Serine/threonine protein kinase, partial [Globisporangium splendens]
MFGACHLRRPYLLTFEITSTTSLREYLRMNENRHLVWNRLYEIALGLKYLHSKRVVLGKLRCDRILIGSDGVARIAECGFEPASDDPQSERDDARWSAPECLSKQEAPTELSDIYCFGMLILDAVSSIDGFTDSFSVAGWSQNDRRDWLDIVDGMFLLKEAEWNLARRMCCFDPSWRTTMDNVVDHLKEFSAHEAKQVRQCAAPGVLVQSLAKSLSVDFTYFHELHAYEGFVTPQLQSSIAMHLNKLASKCSFCHRHRGAIDNICKRLVDIQKHLSKFPALPDVLAVKKFCHSLGSFDKILGIVGVHERSIKRRERSQEVSLKFNTLRREIDGVLNAFPAFTYGSIHAWRENDEKDSSLSAQAELEIRASNAVTTVHHETAYDSSQERRHFYPREPLRFIPPNELNCRTDEEIGSGAFGKVYKGKWDDTPVVIKVVGLEKEANDNDREMFQHELGVWSKLNHPHFVRLCSACQIGKLYFVCELAANGTLQDYLSRQQNRDHTWEKLYEIGLGFQYMHDMNVLHNDLRCDNLLARIDGKAKITDFGLSCILLRAEARLDHKKIGAKQWKPPEYLKGERLTLASGMFSFGMCILEAVTGMHPWGRMDDPVAGYHIKRGKLPLRPGQFTDRHWNLIEMMCATNPLHRIRIASVVDKLYALSQSAAMPLNSKASLKRLVG